MATKAEQIEMIGYQAEYAEKSGRECVAQALARLRRMVEEIERECARPENSLSKVVYHFRHNMAWAAANIGGDLDTATDRALDAAVADAKLAALATE